MKIYFAGPLFTPYVREWISHHAQILRDHGMDPFVPHESFRPRVSPEGMRLLAEKGLLTVEQLSSPSAPDVLNELLRSGRVRREDIGLPPMTPEHIFGVDLGGLRAAHAVLAVLDGTQVDDGTACELGIFYGLMRSDPSKKGIVGLMTDARGARKAATNWGLNYFVLGTIEECGKVVADFQDALALLKEWHAELTKATERPQ
jgi:nucleoside 2-deoxyribosyltransferase